MPTCAPSPSAGAGDYIECRLPTINPNHSRPVMTAGNEEDGSVIAIISENPDELDTVWTEELMATASACRAAACCC